MLTPKILGSLPIPPLLTLYLLCMIITPLYTYHIAVSSGQQPPFPHCTVTSTAQKYPQNIIFRFVMMFCSSVLALNFWSIFRWLKSTQQRIKYKYLLPKYTFYIAQFSILCYSLTIATIDSGGTKHTIHGVCAVIFFVIWMLTLTILTIHLHKMYNWDTTAISKLSLNIKSVLTAYIGVVWVYCIYGLAVQQQQRNDSIYVVIVQWNSVMVNLLWTFSLWFDWRQYQIVLVSNK